MSWRSFEMIKTFIKENDGNEALKADFLVPLKAASKDLQAAGMYFMQNGVKNPNNALAGSYDFHAHDGPCLSWPDVGAHGQGCDGGIGRRCRRPAFYETKIATGRYYMARQLPATAMHLARINTGADTVMALDADQF